jgi:hypothetical protein
MLDPLKQFMSCCAAAMLYMSIVYMYVHVMP